MTHPLIDPSVYSDLAEAMGADFVEELVTTFLTDAPNMFDELKQALAQDDADGFRRAAHSIKSNAQVFGANALADQARALELDGPGNGEVAVPALEAIYADTATALKGLMYD